MDLGLLVDSPKRYPLDHDGLMEDMFIFALFKFKIDNPTPRTQNQKGPASYQFMLLSTIKNSYWKFNEVRFERGGFQLMQILD